MNEYESKPVFYNYIIVDPRKPTRFSCEHLNMSLLYEPIYVGKGQRFVGETGVKYDRIKKGQFGVISTNKIKLTSKLKNTLGWIIEPH